MCVCVKKSINHLANFWKRNETKRNLFECCSIHPVGEGHDHDHDEEEEAEDLREH